MTTPDPHRDGDHPEETATSTPAPQDSGREHAGRTHSGAVKHRDAATGIGRVKHTRTRATFIGLVIGAIITILLLVFILQNLNSQSITLFAWEVHLPVGVSLLIAAIAGALITALVGGVRMMQLSRALKRMAKSENH